MSELQQRPEETPENWLSRLERIDPAGLSRDGQRTLALSLGYARFLAHKSRGTSEAADRALPQPEWVVVGGGGGPPQMPSPPANSISTSSGKRVFSSA